MAFTHTSSDFGLILLDVANKSVLAGCGGRRNLPLWTKSGILTDFSRRAASGWASFPRCVRCVRAPSTSTSPLGERGEQIILATYGELFSITRQAIINDDLQMLSDIPF
ncbi:hypothetical protein ACPA9J_10280 [Pseudomonas aeruginosa]